MLELWHVRLGHPSLKVIELVSTINARRGGNVLNKPCDIRHRAKHTRDSFPISASKAFDMFELIHCHLWGTYRAASYCGAYYILTIVDDFSRVTWVTLLVDKTKVSQILENFFAMTNRQFHKWVKIVRSDNGIKFTCMKNYFLTYEIIFQTSCTRMPQQNGRVKRKHQHILNVAQALHSEVHLPIEFWGNVF